MMKKNKSLRIIDKVKINQSIVKNKLKTPGERKRAYLELKRLNSLKLPGTILKRPTSEMLPVSPRLKPYEHHYMIYKTEKNNNTQVCIITHSKKAKIKKVLYSLSDDKISFISLKTQSKTYGFRNKNKNLKYYDFYESNMNKKIDPSEVESVLKEIKDTIKK